MFAKRLITITTALLGLGAFAVQAHLRGIPLSEALPERLRAMLEKLGPAFVKVGQALSLHHDILPDAYIAALRTLQDHVAPFPSNEAVKEIERGLRQPIEALFSEFDRTPMAAASIAQVHAARLHDGRKVVVKVRRPHILGQIERDMRALIVVMRVLVALRPRFARHQPIRLVEEIWTNMRKEADFRQEAQNIVRFAAAFQGWSTVNVPGLADDRYSESVIVQEMSSGRRIDDPSIAEDGPRLAGVLVDAYLHQFFVAGLFHGDPHPGNLFVMDDGRLCFHDLGLVGFLDRRMRRGLAMFLDAFVNQDAEWILDAAIDLRIIGAQADRISFTREIEVILADYSTLPLKDWSLAEALLRITRLSRSGDVTIPHNLLVLTRTLFLGENAVRTLDPNFDVLNTLRERGAETLAALVREPSATRTAARLKHEAAITLQELPALLGSLLHKATREGGAFAVNLNLRGLTSLEQHIDRSGNRLSLALVTLGLYVAASLLMQHSLGPRLFGEMPVLAAIGYAIALWFTLRLARGISRSGRL